MSEYQPFYCRICGTLVRTAWHMCVFTEKNGYDK